MARSKNVEFAFGSHRGTIAKELDRSRPISVPSFDKTANDVLLFCGGQREEAGRQNTRDGWWRLGTVLDSSWHRRALFAEILAVSY